jgi:hypothetical protein
MGVNTETASEIALRKLMTVLDHLRENDCPDEIEDALLDVMDQLEGWCSRKVSLRFGKANGWA